MAGNTVQSSIGIAKVTADRIKARAGRLRKGKTTFISVSTTLSVNSRCKQCFNKKNTILSSYTSIIEKDAQKIIKVAGTFDNVDNTISGKIKRK